jgi:hypothetical protein
MELTCITMEGSGIEQAAAGFMKKREELMPVMEADTANSVMTAG